MPRGFPLNFNQTPTAPYQYQIQKADKKTKVEKAFKDEI